MDELRSDAKFLRVRGRRLIEEGTAQERNLALKFYDVALKYERTSLEIRQRIADREHDRWLVEQNRILQGGVSH